MGLMLLLLTIAAGTAGGWWLAELVVRRAEMRARIDTALDALIARTCVLCDAAAEAGDGDLCPTCRLLIDVTDRPVPYWPTEGDPT